MAAVVAVCLAAAPAFAAALPDSALTCRKTIAKNYQSLVNTAVKSITSCHKARDKGDATLTGTDCNDITAADAATGGKYASAVTKFTTNVTTACASENELLNSSWYYNTCPAPCTGAIPDPMTTMNQVRDCLSCMAGAIVGAAAETTLGSPSQATISASSVDQKCHGAITKGWGKFVKTALKIETGCQADEDALGSYIPSVCTDSDPKGKSAGAAQKAKDGITAACTPVSSLADMDGCATDTVANFNTCTQTAWQDADNDAYRSIFTLDSDKCPKVIRTTIFAGCSAKGDGYSGTCSSGNTGNSCNTNGDCGTGGTCQQLCSIGKKTTTQLSVGWTGLGHNIDVTDQYTLAGSVTCPGSTAGSCGTCNITGISNDSPQYYAFTRCQDAPWTACTMPFLADPACGGGPCAYFLGPPLAVSAGGTPTCTLNIVTQDVTGTVSPDAGESLFHVHLSSQVHTGANQSRPCPICRDDLVAEDGHADGTCLGGPREGLPCDVQGFDLSWAFQANHQVSGQSLDCPPSVGSNISGTGLRIDLPLSTGAASLTAQDACDPEGGHPELKCTCGVCTGNQTLSCNTDDECDLADDGMLNNTSSCTQGVGEPRLPNKCSDLTCVGDPMTEDRGLCANAPDVDTFCDTLFSANGHGALSCQSNTDCNALHSNSTNADSWSCPANDCGICQYPVVKSCFFDPITVHGVPDKVNPQLAGLFCLPPSTNGSVNSVTGAPGPGTVNTSTVVEERYF
ncbi:MAG TPA: hypothetical protein VGK20_18730 [Candidatus Binatia bacterium]